MAFEKFKEIFKGELAKRQQPKKQAAYAASGYEAAAFTRDRSFVWTTSEAETVNPPGFTRLEIARLTRYLINNFPLAERILTVSESYGVGGGLIASASTSDADFNTAATAAFDGWASNVFCSVNNQYNLYEMQKLLVRELIIAGEVFIVLTKSIVTNYPQLMLVATERVKHSGEQGDNSIDGVYVDDLGKITAYNIFTGDTCQKIDASNVIHIMRHKQIGQLRGIGSFAASLNSMRDLKDCMVLEKKAIKIHSSLAAVVQKKSGEAENGLMGNVLSADVLGNPLTNPQTQSTNIGLEKAFAGAVVYTEPGESVNLIASDRSSEGFFKFIETLLREVCLNISLPYEFLVNADKLAGTGIRFVLGDASFFFSNLQNMLLDGAMNRIYSWVIASLIKDGKLKAPAGGELPWGVSWTKPISVTVDTQRISNAEIAQLQNSLMTYDMFYSARGRDWRQELRQHAEEEAFLDELSKETGVPIGRLRSLPAGTTLLPAVREQENVMENPSQIEEEDKNAAA